MSNEQSTQVIASDLEGTLSSGKTWKAIANYLVTHGHTQAYRVFFITHLPGYLFAKIGLADPIKFGQQWIIDIAKLFKGFDQTRLNELGEWIVDQELWPNRRQAVVAELISYREQGCRVVICSGAYQFIVDAFARRLAVEGIGTPLPMKNGAVLGQVTEAFNTGTVKVQRLQAVLNGTRLGVAYGDTAADVPLLELSQTPVAVAPDKALRSTAVARNWRIMVG